MATPSTYDKLTTVLRDAFDNDHLVASPSLAANQVDGWDSLANVRLFVEIEQTFSIRFSAMEMASLRNVGQLADMIEKKSVTSGSAGVSRR